MPRAKRRPASAEIIQFADLKARREARREGLSTGTRASLHVSSGDVRKGDIVLCALVRGGYAPAVAARDEEGGFCDIRQPSEGNAARVVGRVVLVDNVEGD